MATRALVTGCAGFIGSHLSERLLADGVEVVGVDCLTDYYPRERKLANLGHLTDHDGFELHQRDLAADPVEDLVQSVDVVYHLAAQPGVRGSFGEGFDVYVRNNITATQRLLEAASTATLSKFVYASSSAVYGAVETFPTPEDTTLRAVSPYGMTKCSCEDLAGVYHRTAGVPVVGMRYFTAYGPRQRPDMAFSRFIDAALAGESIRILGDGRQIRDFTYIDDVVAGTLAAGARGVPGRAYNIGGGTPCELLDVVSVLSDVLGTPVGTTFLPGARGDARHTCADGSLAERDLRFKPSIPVSEGLARQVEWVLASRQDSGARLRRAA